MSSQLKYVLAGAETLKADGNSLFSKNQFTAAVEKCGPAPCAQFAVYELCVLNNMYTVRKELSFSLAGTSGC
jgi:hypothetical protein